MRSRLDLIWTQLKQGTDPNQILVKMAVRRALLGCDNVLDVGCGVSMLMRELGVTKCTGADGYAPAVEKARRLGTHDELVHCSISELPQRFTKGQFDACIAMDVIEHLPKEDGLRMIAILGSLAKKRIVFFTPNGFLPQKHAANDDLQEHLSGWTATEMRGLGFDVLGALGPKRLRGEYHKLRKRPVAFWALVSLFLQLTWIERHPEKSAAILCIKENKNPASA